MKKKILGLILGTGLCTGMLTGCGSLLQDYSEYVELGQYEGIEYVPMSTEVTDEELQVEVDYFLSQMGETEEITEGVIEDGDTINLDYIGYCDGEAFEGGSTDGAGTQLTIGSHSYIDDFEEQLIGHEIGEEGIEVNVTFPDPYDNNPDLAGKAATFVCKINCKYNTIYPEELTDELVGENTEYDTVNSFMDGLKMDYEEYKAQQAESKKNSDIIQAVIANANISGYPEEEVSSLTDQTIEAAKQNAESYGMDFETYLSYLSDESGNPYTEETYQLAAENYMRELLNEKMVVCMIARELGYKVTQKDIDEYITKEAAENTSIDEAMIRENYSDEDLAYAVIYDKVLEYLVENAVAIEE